MRSFNIKNLKEEAVLNTIYGENENLLNRYFYIDSKSLKKIDIGQKINILSPIKTQQAQEMVGFLKLIQKIGVDNALNIKNLPQKELERIKNEIINDLRIEIRKKENICIIYNELVLEKSLNITYPKNFSGYFNDGFLRVFNKDRTTLKGYIELIENAYQDKTINKNKMFISIFKKFEPYDYELYIYDIYKNPINFIKTKNITTTVRFIPIIKDMVEQINEIQEDKKINILVLNVFSTKHEIEGMEEVMKYINPLRIKHPEIKKFIEYIHQFGIMKALALTDLETENIYFHFNSEKNSYYVYLELNKVEGFYDIYNYFIEKKIEKMKEIITQEFKINDNYTVLNGKVIDININHIPNIIESILNTYVKKEEKWNTQ